MAYFSKRELMRLLEIANKPCVSIYMPTHRMGTEIQQDTVRLKNLLAEAEDQLVEKTNLSRLEINKFLSSSHRLIDNRNFWKQQEDGLAIFLTKGYSLTYRLPFSFSEELIVSDQFYVRPLLPVISGNGEYYILAMSQNDVRLFKANRDHIHTLDVEGLTTSLATALKLDQPQPNHQMHQSGSTLYHGHGAGNDQQKSNILQFFQKVDSDLRPHLIHTDAPLIFVGVDYLFPLYQKANSYPHLCETSVSMNPDQAKEAELQALTWPLVQSIFEDPMKKAIADYCDRHHTSETTSDLLEILNAAHDGQVETLLIANDHKIMGQFNAEHRELELSFNLQDDGDELLNLAIIYTLFCNGTVYPVDRQQLPDQENMTAILRYPMSVNSGTLSR